MSGVFSYRLVQCDWHRIYEDKESLVREFPELTDVDITQSGWFERNGDWAFLAPDQCERQWWKVMVWNNRDPRQGLRDVANRPVLVSWGKDYA